MNLKDLAGYFFLPHPTIKEVRERYNKEDQSVFLTTDFIQKTVTEKFKFFGQNVITIFDYINKHHPEERDALLTHLQFIAPTGTFYLTYNGFFPPIKLLATPEQLSKWEKLMNEGRLFGSYAQTEIGHGSDVQGLMTTATYNKERKTFVLNSPNVKSAKFWPGGLGILCTHGVVQAQTYVNGKHYGLQTFVVPLRDPKTYKAYDGVDVGDIGPKLAYSWGDNGYLKLTNYEIPLDNLLMKFFKVEEDGTVSNPGDKNAVKIGYGGMLGLRVALSKYFLIETYRGVMIGHRCLNKAGNMTSLQKRKLLNDYAYVYCGMMTIEWMTRMFNRFTINVSKDVKKALGEIEELHLVASGLKSLFSWKLVESLRKVSVGQTLGSLMVTGTVSSYGDIVPSVTYEGDNVVMLQQTARGLCKYMQCVEAEDFNKIPKSFKFLEEKRALLEIPDEMKVRVNKYEELLNLDKIEELIDVIGLFTVKENFEKMKQSLMGGDSMNTMWNEKLQEAMINMAMVVCKGLTFKMTRKLFEKKSIVSGLGKRDVEILMELLVLNGLNILEEDLNLACRYKIGEEGAKLEEMIHKAQDVTYGKLDGHLNYLGDSCLLYEQELYFVRDFKNFTPLEKGSDRIRATMEKDPELMKNYINTFSKL